MSDNLRKPKGQVQSVTIPDWAKILIGVIIVLGLICLIVGWAGPWQIAPNERWVKNGAILVLVTAIIAVVTVTAGALILIVAAAWSIIAKQPSPFASLSTAQVRSIRNNASLTVLMTLIFAGLAGIPFAFGAVQQPFSTHTWLAAEFSALGILLVGATFGFLFGLPHFADPVAANPQQGGGAGAAASASGAPGSQTLSVSVAQNPAFTPSTNLEKVSAQLVTLFSGLAFASILTIPVYIGAFASFFENGIHGHGASLLGAGLVTYFGPLGFITAYVVTRTIGAQAFARSDTELMGITATVTNNLPPLPDMVSELGDKASLSATDLITVQRAASVGFDQLTSVEDFQTWGRAHSLLGDLKGARRAFERAYTKSSGDPRVIMDYATALYNDPDWDDATYVFQKAKEAQAIETAATSPTLRARTLSLETAALLYMPARYVDAVTNANQLLSAALPPLPTTRFYRACALGQLLWAYVVSNRLIVGSPGWDAIIVFIRFDIAVAMQSGDGMRQKVKMVIDPAGRKDAHDCDLQFAACHDATLTSIAHVGAPPQAPDPKYQPALVDPPNVAAPPAWDSDIVAWVKTFPP
jgi:hypothetical protein